MEASPEPKLQAPLRLLLPVVIVSALMASAAALRPREDLAVRGCVVHEGEWVPIDSQRRVYPYDNSCPFIDERQTCRGKGKSFLDWEWQPSGCDLPLFDPSRFLELLRNRIMAFVGDSLGRNQYESLSCLLAREDGAQQEGAKKGLITSRHYPKYNATVKLILSPYLVEHRPREYSQRMGHKSVHLDVPDPDWHLYAKHLDVILFATSGRWFLGSAKFAMKYTQSSYNQATGNKVDVLFVPPAASPWEAIGKAFKTVRKSLTTNGVFLWKTYSPSHFAGGRWDQGGHCHDNIFPNEVADQGMDRDPNIMPVGTVMRNVLHGQQERVAIFNITYMAERRNDAHPGNLNNIAQKGSSAQDCVHWCLPGMPDIWNRFLMVHLERKLGSSPPGPGIPRKLPPTEDL